MNIRLSDEPGDSHAAQAMQLEKTLEDQTQEGANDRLTESQNTNENATSCDLDECNVERGERSDKNDLKRRSMGFLASFLSCGVVIGFTESIVSEGPRTVTDHLLSMKKYGASMPSALLCEFVSLDVSSKGKFYECNAL